jgi:hypothetical protein
VGRDLYGTWGGPRQSIKWRGAHTGSWRVSPALLRRLPLLVKSAHNGKRQATNEPRISRHFKRFLPAFTNPRDAANSHLILIISLASAGSRMRIV